MRKSETRRHLFENLRFWLQQLFRVQNINTQRRDSIRVLTKASENSSWYKRFPRSMIFLVLFATPLVSFKKFRCINYISFFAIFFLLFLPTLHMWFKKLKNRNTGLTVGLNCCIFHYICPWLLVKKYFTVSHRSFKLPINVWENCERNRIPRHLLLHDWWGRNALNLSSRNNF